MGLILGRGDGSVVQTLEYSNNSTKATVVGLREGLGSAEARFLTKGKQPAASLASLLDRKIFHLTILTDMNLARSASVHRMFPLDVAEIRLNIKLTNLHPILGLQRPLILAANAVAFTLPDPRRGDRGKSCLPKAQPLRLVFLANAPQGNSLKTVPIYCTSDI